MSLHFALCSHLENCILEADIRYCLWWYWDLLFLYKSCFTPLVEFCIDRCVLCWWSKLSLTKLWFVCTALLQFTRFLCCLHWCWYVELNLTVFYMLFCFFSLLPFFDSEIKLYLFIYMTWDSPHKAGPVSNYSGCRMPSSPFGMDCF